VRTLFTIFISLALGVPVFARIGETEAEIRARYGKPIKIDSESGLWLFRPTGDVRVALTFFDGKSACEVYDKPDKSAFSDNEIQVLLDANSSGKQWTEALSTYEFKMWTLDTMGRKATYVKLAKQLIVATSEYLRAEEVRKARRESEKLKGF
jgi:hypothetical protein